MGQNTVLETIRSQVTENDIVRESYQAGELEDLLKDKGLLTQG